jgi:hypothetical protein
VATGSLSSSLSEEQPHYGLSDQFKLLSFTTARFRERTWKIDPFGNAGRGRLLLRNTTTTTSTTLPPVPRAVVTYTLNHQLGEPTRWYKAACTRRHQNEPTFLWWQWRCRSLCRTCLDTCSYLLRKVGLTIVVYGTVYIGI